MTQYTRNPPLLETEVHAEPLAQLGRWLDDARSAGQIEPTAMTLATVGDDGRPSARIVLFKGFDGGGLTFYTNQHSRKGREIGAHPDVALTFWWDRLERQVRVEGRAEPLPRSTSEQYFAGRPRESQLGAWASRQSEVVADRAQLDARFADVVERHIGRDVGCPPHWGGYRVMPALVEFWQGRVGRLHDRLRYRPHSDGTWRVERLEP